MKGHVFCWLSAMVFVCLRYVGREKDIEIPGFPRSPEPSRTTNKHKNTRKTCFVYSNMKVPNLPPLRVDALENPIRVIRPGGVDVPRYMVQEFEHFDYTKYKKLWL